jgi:hypothetical protein
MEILNVSWRKSWPKLNIFGKNGDGECKKRQLLPEERSVWDDYLDLAHLSPCRGHVCISVEIGYSHEQLSKILKTPAEVIKRAEDKMVTFEMIKIFPNRVVGIENWKKYQSEYDRQLQYRVTTKGYNQKLQREENRIEENRKDNNNYIYNIYEPQKFFYTSYKQAFDKEYFANFGKDGKLFKALQKMFDVPRLKELITCFFASSDKFIKESDYSIGVFYSQINRLNKGVVRKGRQDE